MSRQASLIAVRHTSRRGEYRFQYTRRIAFAVSACCVVAVGGRTDAAVVFSDQFTINDGTGTAGANLNGTTTELGGKTWIAETSVDFQANNTIQRDLAGAGNNVAAVAFTPPVNGLVSLQASIRPHDNVNGGNFMGAGFTDNTDLQPFWSGGGAELWLHIRSNGGYEAFANATNTVLVSSAGPAPGFVSNGFNTVEIYYDPVLNQVSMLINSTLIVNAYDLDNVGYTPNIGAAALFMLSNESAADWITVSAVPEPAGGLLLCLGGVVAFGHCRRRLRRVAG